MNFVQSSFLGGQDLISSEAEIADNAYRYLINARQRFGDIEPILRHEQITIPAGTLQGGIAVGNVLFIFVSGEAYYMIEGDDEWIFLAPFQMSAIAQRIWAQAVPNSSMNLKRQLDVTNNAASDIKVVPNIRISGTPSCIVVQDGESQPWLIFSDTDPDHPSIPVISCREAGTYSDWKNNSATPNDREYVPVGRQMMYKDGILYIVHREGKSVMRSITGRPLDFMINVDINGNKLSSEAVGGAATLSFAFDFDTITCLRDIDVADSFVYATANTTRIITTDYSNTLFGEPRFRQAAKIESGIVNQESFVEVIGDYTFIDSEGVKSFNAVRQLKFEGRNSVFSKGLSKILNGIKQTRPASIVWDNYALFNLDTKWGNLIAVFDLILDKWVALDVTPLSHVMLFTILTNPTYNTLIALTTNNEVFKMFQGPSTEVGQLRTKALIASETRIEHKGQFVRLLFGGSKAAGTVSIIEYVDDQESPDVRETKIIDETLAGIPYPVRAPVVPSNKQRADNPTFATSNGLIGKKIAYVVIWDNDAALEELQVITSESADMTSQKQKNQVYGN